MTLDWSRATVFTAAAFEACWEVLGLGETPWQLEPPRHGRTAAVRQAFVADVVGCLRGAGPELAAALRLLARPEWSVDVRLRAGSLVAGVAACRGATGALAVRHDDAVAVLDIAAADAVDAVLDLLGPVRPGPGRPITMTTAADAAPELEAACRDVRMFGQLGTSTATRDGHRMRRSPRVVGFHRTACGDYRSVRFDRSGVAVEPATRARLTADLDALLTVAG